jgi:3-oxoacyl-[acyl-carrier protein] reductase
VVSPQQDGETYAGRMTDSTAPRVPDHQRRGVLVTGASRGVGAEVARTFANVCGDRVAIHCRGSRAEADELREALDGGGHVVVQGDLASPEDVRRFVGEAIEALGRVDVLVNNAALFADDPSVEGRRLSCGVAESSYDEWVSAWRRTMDVNLLGTANVTYQVARHMIEVEPADGLPRGRIVNVGSRGAYRGEPDVPAYGASKAAVHSMTQSLAVALAPHGIGCVGIAPGFIATDMTAELLESAAGQAIRAQSPFGRVATTQEVALAIMALAGPQAEWASGSIVDFNGASYLH